MFERIAILGTGALGGYYGALLQRTGREVHFLLHSDYAWVREHGLRIESPGGDFDLPRVHAHATPDTIPACDAVIVALKTTHNELLSTLLPPLMQDDRTVAVILQNGLGVEAEAAAFCDPERIVGGLCFLCSNKVGPGHVHHLDYGLISLGEYRADGAAGGITERLQALGACFEQAGIPVKLTADLAAARWRKLVWNVPFNGLSVVLDAATNVLVTEPGLRELSLALMREVQRGAAACSRPIEDAFLEKMIGDTEKMEPYLTSMKLDYDRGHPMEIEHVYGNPLRAAAEHGVQLPRIHMLYTLLKHKGFSPRGH